MRYIAFAKTPEPRANINGATDPARADRLISHFASVGPGTAAALAAAASERDAMSPRPPRVYAGPFGVKPATLPELPAAL